MSHPFRALVSGLSPRHLEIELTESALLVDFDLAQQILGDLKAIGVRLVLDDFGTGYSSLRHLHVLPIDKLKIDASFVRSMQGSAASRTIIAAIAGLGHSLGIPSVAEGIEDSSTAAALTALGCDMGQGWLYGRAVSAKQVQVMLADLGFGPAEASLFDVALAELRPSLAV